MPQRHHRQHLRQHIHAHNGQPGHLQYVLIVGRLMRGGAGGIFGAIATFLQMSRNFLMPISRCPAGQLYPWRRRRERIFELIRRTRKGRGLCNAGKRQQARRLVEAKRKDGHLGGSTPPTAQHIRLQGDIRFFDVDFATSRASRCCMILLSTLSLARRWRLWEPLERARPP